MASRTLRYLLAAVLVSALYFAFGACAQARPPVWRQRPLSPPYSFSVEDENGASLPTFRQGRRIFLLGEPGLRYNIRVRNPTAQRVEAVVSVDGRDAVGGQPADYVNGRGYVIPPYGSVLVEGFRRSMEEVAAFRFTSPDDSYSARMGTPENVGVIGVAFFPERVRRPTPLPAPLRYDYSAPSFDGQSMGANKAAPSATTAERPRAAPPSTGASAHRADQAMPAAPPRREAAKGAARDDDFAGGSVNNLGTEFGEKRESAVSSVSFERASQAHPALIASLRYDDADGLSGRGIDLSALGYSQRQPMNAEPEPFPASHFAEPPP